MIDWTNDRTEELKKLQMLLNGVRDINHGGGACERIRWCEKIAESLRSSDINSANESFIQFLVSLAAKDRSSNNVTEQTMRDILVKPHL